MVVVLCGFGGFGFMVNAFILVTVGTSEQLNAAKAAREALLRVKGVKNVYGVFGRFDFVVFVETGGLEELSRIVLDNIRAIPGVLSTESLVVGY